MNVSNTRLVNTTALIFCVSLLSACSTQPMTQSQTQLSSVSPAYSETLPEQVSHLLNTNQHDVSITVPSGVYQNNTLTAGMTYFAASGRICREVLISDQSTKEKHIACRSGAASWQLVRAVM